MERFTGMGFIRLCSSVHNIDITLLQVQNTEKQTKMIRHLFLLFKSWDPLEFSLSL